MNIENREELLLKDKGIIKAAYKYNAFYKDSMFEYTRKPDADREIAQAQLNKALKLFHLEEGHGHKFEFCDKHYIFDCIECFGLDEPDSRDWWWFQDKNRFRIIPLKVYQEGDELRVWIDHIGSNLAHFKAGKWQKAFMPELPNIRNEDVCSNCGVAFTGGCNCKPYQEE